jgi:hypothetical protein
MLRAAIQAAKEFECRAGEIMLRFLVILLLTYAVVYFLIRVVVAYGA